MGESFTINIGSTILDDLKTRLGSARWTDELANAEWEYGTNKAYLKELCNYWQHEFDWRKQEAYLNSFEHFKTAVDDLRLHFIYQKGRGQISIPLLLTHGYPDSFVRFLKVIPLLTEAGEDRVSFDVVVPSIPGYGFSDVPVEPGMDTKKIAGLFVKLMKELGYEKFIAHGGDWGSSIAEQIALYHPDSLIAIHLTDVPFQHGLAEYEDLSRAESKYIDGMKMWQQTEGGYAMIQSTKPQTLAYALNDSPSGLAAWLVEKFRAWSDNDGDVENCFSKDELLTNLTIYWSTQTINSAFRIYYEAMQSLMKSMYNPLNKLNPFDKTGTRSAVPAAFALFPKDISSPPREFAERFFNVQRWTEMSKGGHFAAMEQPDTLVSDIRKFVTQLRAKTDHARS